VSAPTPPALMCFVNAANKHIYDDVKPDSQGIYRTRSSGETLEQLQAKYPAIQLQDQAQAWLDWVHSYRQDPKRISAERYDAMLNILPPMRWVQDGDRASFKMSEFTFDKITDIFAKIGEDYFQLTDDYTLDHDDIMTLCQAFLRRESSA
jgi:nicotinamide riboside kinase